jgi:hypothetical protein
LEEAHAFCCRLISQPSPFPLPPQLSKHLPNLSLSLSSLCRDLPMQVDRRGRGEEPVKTTGKKRELPSNVFPLRTAFRSGGRGHSFVQKPTVCTDMYYMGAWTCPYIHNSYIKHSYIQAFVCLKITPGCWRTFPTSKKNMIRELGSTVHSHAIAGCGGQILNFNEQSPNLSTFKVTRNRFCQPV